MSERTIVREVPPDDERRMGTAATYTLISGALLTMLSFFITNVALPSIGTDLHATPAALQLVIGCYGIATAALVVVGGRLGDSYGRKRLFLIGMAGFGVFSLLCALSPNIGTLLAMRAGQGASGAMMTPQVLAIISATLTGEHRVRAIGLFGAAGGLATAFGQILGGVLVEANIAGLQWRSVFLVTVPISAVGFVFALRLLPETKAERRLAIDWVGAILLIVTLSLLLFPLTEGRPLGWPLWIWLVMAASVPAGAAFLFLQRRLDGTLRTPLVPPSTIALPPLRLGLTVAVAFFTTFGGFMFVVAIATQTGAGMSALEGGLTLLSMAIGFLAVSIPLPALQRRYGGYLITTGWIMLIIGYCALGAVVLLSWPHITPWNLAAPLLVGGAGQGLVMMPLFGVVIDQVPAEQAGLGSGVLVTTQQTCIALGAATVGTAYLALTTSAWGQGGAFAATSIGIAIIGLAAIPLSQRLAKAH
ncbi:putative MFS family arabinose efflux permease [Antricoccus suffuscus]|uniref:Putative MFS family arabinose efflux permease n=1 Tax=Antricoccus suffuscus TaxID=1629062 RepID=A0A2T1A364_9ACTN|nr:MFS transporter [Antricoccus suffuscus]PRZ43051.1 putative MFS family arabinose efflux permease [Antricoccus suffuscus]